MVQIFNRQQPPAVCADIAVTTQAVRTERVFLVPAAVIHPDALAAVVAGAGPIG